MFAVLGLTSNNVIIPFFRGEGNLRDLIPVYETRPAMMINTSLDYRANINTNFGTIVIDLFENSAPVNVNNFTFLSNDNFYNGTKFHRLIPGLLVQGGDPLSTDENLLDDGLGGPGYVIEDEINLYSLSLSDERISQLESEGVSSNRNLQSANLVKYTVAMANSGRNTNGSQFFIIIADSSDQRVQLMNGQYTVIGQIIDGFGILNNINQVQVDDPLNNVLHPLQDIVINNVSVYTI